MSDLKVVQQPEVSNSEQPTPSPFPSLEDLRLPQHFIETAGVKKVLTVIPIRKPHSQEFFRAHRDPAFRFNMLAIELKDEREVYLVHPSVAGELEGELKMVTLFTCVSRAKVIFLWPVTIAPPDGRKPLLWWTSAREAAEMAMDAWIRIKANRALGAYEPFKASDQTTQPDWADLPGSFEGVLRIAAKDYLVDRPEHSIIIARVGSGHVYSYGCRPARHSSPPKFVRRNTRQCRGRGGPDQKQKGCGSW